MPILQFTSTVTGLEGILPGIVYVNTDDDVSTITTPGYLNAFRHNGELSTDDIVLVNSTTGPEFYNVMFVGENVELVPLAGTGDVAGPSSSTDSAVALWNGTTGKVLKNSVMLFNNTLGILNGVEILNIPSSGTVNYRAGSGPTFWNAANSFSTQFFGTAAVANTQYIYPPNFPAVSGYVLSSTTSGDMTWVAQTLSSTNWVVQTTPTTMVKDTAYFVDSVSSVTLTMPASAAVGDTFKLVQRNIGPFVVQLNGSQVASYLGNATSTGGNITSVDQGSYIEIVCDVANTHFIATVVSGFTMAFN